ncbi:DUF2958 domain-containing protein [Pedobacter sp. HMF7056]|uniref:DUF2958 domain-containing protein n=2 Tax=Hufsiella ginkgonis TaxID=2695274 RepID=A0A7K1Y2I8_9SPHI|nr:DUF2958 domain-containing protein [Hufsiella ginkgonis]
MKLFTQAQYDKMIENGRPENRDTDHYPVVKLFMLNMLSMQAQCVWLLTELDPDYPDHAFGLCDLGFGTPELGLISIQEILDAQGPIHVIGRDDTFKGNFPISFYAAAARHYGFIVDDDVDVVRFVPKPRP